MVGLLEFAYANLSNYYIVCGALDDKIFNFKEVDI